MSTVWKITFFEDFSPHFPYKVVRGGVHAPGFSICSQLRVGEPKRCVTRNLLNFNLLFRLRLRVGEPKRYTTRNLLNFSLFYYLRLRVGEPKRYTTRK